MLLYCFIVQFIDIIRELLYRFKTKADADKTKVDTDRTKVDTDKTKVDTNKTKVHCQQSPVQLIEIMRELESLPEF